jgi:molybdopterin synthase catalytic subunit
MEKDEVGLDGGAAPAEALFEVGELPLDVGRVQAAVAHPGAGAISTFTGIVRDHTGARSTIRLEYEAFRPMAVAEMRRIGDEVAARWPGARVAMAHRIGRLEIGEASVVIAVACAHRAEAIAACHWAIDQLKERVPIWKKEFSAEGEFWIEGPTAVPSRP